MLQILSSFILFNCCLSLTSKCMGRSYRQLQERQYESILYSSLTDATHDKSVIDTVPIEIFEMLHENERGPQGLQILLPEIFSACRTIGTALRDGIFTADKTGTENPFGDQQLDVDVRADKVL